MNVSPNSLFPIARPTGWQHIATLGFWLRMSVLVVIVGFYMATVVANMRDERKLIENDIRRLSGVITISAQKHTEAIFGATVQTLTALRSDLMHLGESGRSPQEILDDHFSSPPYLRATLLLDGSGRIQASSFREIIGNDGSAFEFFRSRRTAGVDQVFTGEMIVGDLTQAPHFFSSLALFDRRRGFLGVVAAAYELTYLRDLYAQLVPNEHYAIALYHAKEGLIVASDSEIRTGELPRSSRFPVNVPRNGSEFQGTFNILLEDNGAVLTSTEPVGNGPFFVSTMANVDGLFAQHRQAVQIKYLLAAVFVFTAIGLAIALEIYILEHRRAAAYRATLEADLRNAQKMEALGTLAGGLAHDFNNLLSSIIGFGEIAEDRAAGRPRLKRALEQILLAGRRAESLVSQILTFSRRVEPTRTPVRLDRIIHEVVELIRVSVPPSVRVSLDIRRRESWVLGDASQLDQVIMNLCRNALQAMPDGGELKIVLDRTNVADMTMLAQLELMEGSYVFVSVADTGKGIPERDRDRIFDPFFTTKKVGQGTGLGLSISHGIVKAHGGIISVVTTAGVGTTFTVFLPESNVANGHEADEKPPQFDARGRVALIVDDEEPIVALVEERLASLGFEPIGFSASTEALKAFFAAPERFDLAILDFTMPEPDGIAMSEAILDVRPDLPIILMTGFGSPELRARARSIGIADVIQKPLDTNKIARSVAGAMRAHAAG